MKLQEKFTQLKSEKKCLLATNFYNFETLKGVLSAAKNGSHSIILQLTQSSIDYMGLEVAYTLGRKMLDTFEVEGWIHLDHGGSYELAEACLKVGFDSVMIDASEEPIEKNIRISRKVVELAARYDANVEAELGYIAKLGQSKDKLGFTEPEDAEKFVEETGVNALAVAIGSAHGFYDKEPKLDMERLSGIAASTPAALVLHGGSGIPGTLLQEAISRGICKINLATEIKNIFMKTLRDVLSDGSEIDLRKVFPQATNEVTKLVSQKLDIVSNRYPFPAT